MDKSIALVNMDEVANCEHYFFCAGNYFTFVSLAHGYTVKSL